MTANISLNYNHYMNKITGKLSSAECGLEIMKCRANPLYFMYNYVYIPEIGGSLKYEKGIVHPRAVQYIKSLIKYGRSILMASRQLGKALDLDTLIPLANGQFKKLKHLTLNDTILDQYHNPLKIIAITEVLNNRKCYELEFSNGEKIVADENHQWVINNNLYLTYALFNEYKSDPTSSFIILDGFGEEHYLSSIKEVESSPVKCIQVDSYDGLYLITKSKLVTHNSTISAVFLEWACNFYPRLPATILNANKTFALENLSKVKFIHSNLPEFLKSPLKYKGERKTTMDYSNGSIIRIFYPSTTTSSSMLARSLTAPFLYVDESAFIRYMDEAYASAQPTLVRAREQAKKHGYPSCIAITSTPVLNGYYM